MKREICSNCQRCVAHCFCEPACQFRWANELCLTCSKLVFYVQGLDPSIEPRTSEMSKIGPSKIKGFSASTSQIPPAPRSYPFPLRMLGSYIVHAADEISPIPCDALAPFRESRFWCKTAR